MKTRTMKLKCVLLDASIIIEAYKIGVWEPLIQKAQIFVPSIVANVEALFYQKDINGIPEEINLRKLIVSKRIFELSADALDIAALDDVFDRVFVENIHAGEREALALLYSRKTGDAVFCTSDSAPIRAMVILGLTEKAISFEEVLSQIGHTKKLLKQFTEEWFQKQLELGKQNLISGEGLKPEYRKKLLS
jgi:hypothetical protein